MVVPELVGDALGDRARRDPPGLGVADQPVDAAAELEAQLRQLRALARSRLAGDDDDLVVADRREQLVAPGGDRQRRRDTSGGRRRRAPRSARTRASLPRSECRDLRAIEVSGCRSEHAPGGRDHGRRRSARPGARLSRSTGPLTLTAATTAPAPSTHRRADRRHAGLALLDALDQPAGPSVARQDAPGRADGERQQGALGHDPAQAVRRLQRHHAAPPVALAHEQLHALPGVVAQRGAAPAGRARRAGDPSPAARPSADQLEPEAEPAVRVAAHEAVLLERDGQAVGRRSRQAGRAVAGSSAEVAGRGASARSTATALSRTPTPLTLSICQELVSQM